MFLSPLPLLRHRWIWRLALVVLVVVLPTTGLAEQAGDPRGGFLPALGQFSLALDGVHGDEAPRQSAALDGWP